MVRKTWSQPQLAETHPLFFSEVPCSFFLAGEDTGVGDHPFVLIRKSPEVSRVRHLDSVLAYYLMAVYDLSTS